jgi:hypothetical protein
MVRALLTADLDAMSNEDSQIIDLLLSLSGTIAPSAEQCVATLTINIWKDIQAIVPFVSNTNLAERSKTDFVSYSIIGSLARERLTFSDWILVRKEVAELLHQNGLTNAFSSFTKGEVIARKSGSRQFQTNCPEANGILYDFVQTHSLERVFDIEHSFISRFDVQSAIRENTGPQPIH